MMGISWYIYRWGELESGQTTIAFTPLHQHETDDLTGKVQSSTRSDRERAPLEVCFCYHDVDAAFKVTPLYFFLYSSPCLYILCLWPTTSLICVDMSEMTHCVEGCGEWCGGSERAGGQGMGPKGWIRSRHWWHRCTHRKPR